MRINIFGPLRAALWLALFAVTFVSHAIANPLPGPSVREVVEFTRIVQPAATDPDALRSLVSPDGTRAFVVTRKANVGSDENVFEILLLDLQPDRLLSGRIEAARTVLSVKSRSDENYADPSIGEVRWVDNRTLVFLARVADAPIQVYRLDVLTDELSTLTRETHRIVSFAVSRDLRRVLYAVQVPNPPLANGAHSIVVGNQSFWTVKFGQHDQRSQDRMYRYFVAESGSSLPPRPLGAAFGQANGTEPNVNISPDGRWALLPRYEVDRQLDWARQYPLVAELASSVAPSLSIDPLAYFSRPASYVARRMVAYRLVDGKEHTVVDAPDDAAPGGPQRRSDRLWLGEGRSVVLAGTHLPAHVGQPSVPQSHIIEYWPDMGRWEVIASLASRLRSAHALGANRFVAIDGERRRQFTRRAEGGWREVDEAEVAGPPGNAWTLRLEEGLNQPPDIVATDGGGRTVRLTALNPQFNAAWGTMRAYTWHDAQGRRWNGGLMKGSTFKEGRRHPLVIQTYGFSPRRFYLDGPNEGSGFTSGFAGRAFLRDGIVVLAMPWRASSGAPRDDRASLMAFMDGVRAAVDALVKEGVVDPARVGIIGWSATGERVLNLVTFSDIPIRAATMADGDVNSLFSMAISYGAGDNIWIRVERLNNGLPYGSTLDRWVENDPALHTDCVQAALRIETYGPWVLPNWDIYALLRRQYKPAEMIVIPGGTHSLSRPGERMISLQGNVDWFRFWLKGEDRTELTLPAETPESLAAQYTRWRQMETLKKDAADASSCGRKSGAG
jgi:dipeptidyl aminopeptidase/acylaminoacyl peptidase